MCEQNNYYCPKYRNYFNNGTDNFVNLPSNQKETYQSFQIGNTSLQWIEEQLQQLPSDLQSMISFRYRWGWSLKRIAERFGLKTGSVDGRIRRAIEKLNEKAHREFDES